jgi:uncharacterized coiled-coil protein SlyX
LRIVLPLLLAVAVGSGSLAGCHKSSSDKVQAESVRQSLEGLRKQFAELKTRFMDLRTRVESIKPPEPPGFNDARARFYAAEEARGTTEAKVSWLASRLDTASSTGNRAELDEISKEIAQSQADIAKIEQLHVKLLHQIMSFERMARAEAENTVPPAPPPPPAGAKKKRATAKE